MNRVPNWAIFTMAAILFAFAAMGAVYSEHALARIVYSLLIVASLSLAFYGLRRPSANGLPRSGSVQGYGEGD